MKKFIAHLVTEGGFEETIEVKAEDATEAEEIAREETRDWNRGITDTRDLYSFDRVEEVAS